jgi:hypothetical protein
MSHFARVNAKGVVESVIVAEQEFINNLIDKTSWVQTSYNTRNNKHYDANGKEDGGIALRGNYAGIGYVYDRTNDVFYAPQPYTSWILNQDTWSWESPTPYPNDDKRYNWDEATTSWIEVTE